MNQQINTQLKVMAIQAATGNLETAQAIYAWLAEDNFEAEVRARLERLTGNTAPNVVRIAE